MAEAFKWGHRAAEQSGVEAQLQFAAMYLSEQNDVEAAIWYRKAAEQGNARAKAVLVYVFGEGGEGEQSDHSVVTVD